MKKFIILALFSSILLATQLTYAQSSDTFPTIFKSDLVVFDANTGKDVKPSTKDIGIILSEEVNNSYGDHAYSMRGLVPPQVIIKDLLGNDIPHDTIDQNELTEENYPTNGKYQIYLGTYRISSSKKLTGLIINVIGSDAPGVSASKVVQFGSARK